MSHDNVFRTMSQIIVPSTAFTEIVDPPLQHGAKYLHKGNNLEISAQI